MVEGGFIKLACRKLSPPGIVPGVSPVHVRMVFGENLPEFMKFVKCLGSKGEVQQIQRLQACENTVG